MALDSGALPVALTNTVARTDFNDAMTQLNAAFPLTKFNLGGDSVVTIKIKDLNITTAKLALLAVEAAQLGAQAVETAKIKLLNVTVAQLGPEAVERAKIKLLAVDTPQLEALAVETAKIDNLAVTAAKLNTDAVETLKIKDLNVTPAKAALGFGRYVPRDVAAYDFEVGDFTVDGNAHANGLDASGIVPAGAVAVQFSFYILGPANRLGKIYKNAANPKSEIHLTSNVLNLDIWAIGPVGCDSDRLFDYQFAAGITAIGVSVVGWYI